MLIWPPQLHMHIEVLFKAGIPPIRTVGEPGSHGAGVTGMQGIGVSTPKAAAVAAATMGLASDVHITKGMMLSIGTWSMIVAAGFFSIKTLFVGSTMSVDGAIPKVHTRFAVAMTGCAMS